VSDKIVVTYVVDDDQDPRFKLLPRWKRTVVVAIGGVGTVDLLVLHTWST
jgi:hypothetical protein